MSQFCFAVWLPDLVIDLVMAYLVFEILMAYFRSNQCTVIENDEKLGKSQ